MCVHSVPMCRVCDADPDDNPLSWLSCIGMPMESQRSAVVLPYVVTVRERREQEFEQEVQRMRGLGGGARARARARRPPAGMFAGLGSPESSTRRDFLGYYQVLGLAGQQGELGAQGAMGWLVTCAATYTESFPQAAPPSRHCNVHGSLVLICTCR
jgi:hypothetical protein